MRLNTLPRLMSGTLLLASLCLATVPVFAQKNADPPNVALNNRVNVDVNDAPLYDVLKTMLTQAGLDFTLPDFLKRTNVTVKTNQSLKVALEGVLKASGLPLIYHIDKDGVFRVFSKDIPEQKAPAVGDAQDFLSSPITLDVTNLPLTQAFKIIAGTSRVNIVFPNGYSNKFVTLNVKGTGRQALEALLANSNPPLTYRIQNNVIEIIKKDDAAVPKDEFLHTPESIPLTFASAKAVAAELSKLALFQKGVEVQPMAQDTTLAVTTTNPNLLVAVKNFIKTLDVEPVILTVKAELVVSLEGADGKRNQVKLVSDGTTFSGSEITLDLNFGGDVRKATLNGEIVKDKAVTFERGDCRLMVTPRLNGDGTVSLTSKGNITLAWSSNEFVTPLQFERKINGADRVKPGNTNHLLGTKTKIKNDKSEFNVDVLLVLTVKKQ